MTVPAPAGKTTTNATEADPRRPAPVIDVTVITGNTPNTTDVDELVDDLRVSP